MLTQANNAYIFPGFGLGLVMSGAIRVHDDMLLAACKYMNQNKRKSCELAVDDFVVITLGFSILKIIPSCFR